MGLELLERLHKEELNTPLATAKGSSLPPFKGKITLFVQEICGKKIELPLVRCK
jgi:hypothetical protein